MAPAVGRQVTVSGAMEDGARGLLDVLVTRAAAGDCDLVARVREDGEERGWLLGEGVFRPDRAAEPPVPLTALLEAASPDQPTTFTCVPPGDGLRSALDRDRDGHLTGDELAAGSDPLDPYSHPGGVTPSPTATPRRGAPTAGTPTPDRRSATPTQPTQEPPSPTEPQLAPAFFVWLPAAER